jgi:hypothetical protein
MFAVPLARVRGVKKDGMRDERQKTGSILTVLIFPCLKRATKRAWRTREKVRKERVDAQND